MRLPRPSILSNNETIITFEAAPLGSFTNLVVAPGVTINGTDFGGSPQTILNSPVGSPDGLFGYNTTSGGSQWLSLFGGSITFTFAYAHRGLRRLFLRRATHGETITFNDGAPQSIALPNPGSGVLFIGFTDFGNPITSLTINVQVGGTGDIVGIDDVRFSVAQGPQFPSPPPSRLRVSPWRGSASRAASSNALTCMRGPRSGGVFLFGRPEAGPQCTASIVSLPIAQGGRLSERWHRRLQRA
jgi:hypothetical protein